MKYNEIAKSWDELRLRFRDYHHEVSLLFSQIYNEFVKYLDIPRKEDLLELSPKFDKILRIVPLGEDLAKSEKSNYTPHGAVELQDDGWATGGIIFLLEKGPQTYPKKRYIFTFFMKKKDSKWLVKWEMDGNEYTFDNPPTQSQFISFFDDISKSMNDYFINGLNNWLIGESKKVIGFVNE